MIYNPISLFIPKSYGWCIFNIACSPVRVDSDSHSSRRHQLDGLVQDYSNFIADALDSLQSCTKPSNYSLSGTCQSSSRLSEEGSCITSLALYKRIIAQTMCLERFGSLLWKYESKLSWNSITFHDIRFYRTPKHRFPEGNPSSILRYWL